MIENQSPIKPVHRLDNNTVTSHSAALSFSFNTNEVGVKTEANNGRKQMCLKAFSPRYNTFKNVFLKPFSSKLSNLVGNMAIHGLKETEEL